MMSVSTSEESERRLAEAMRAQATGVGRAGFVGRNPGSIGAPPAGAPGAAGPPGPAPAAAARSGPSTSSGPTPGLWAALVGSRWPLLFALLGGIVLGVALALLSLLAPGMLPALG